MWKVDLKYKSFITVTDHTAEALGFDRPSFQFSISEDPVLKDNILLNYCMEDIERFCAAMKTHKQAETQEVSPRKDPPRAIDFVNIFQKFKLAFNLLVSSKPAFLQSNYKVSRRGHGDGIIFSLVPLNKLPLKLSK